MEPFTLILLLFLLYIFYIYFDFHRNEAHPHSGCLGEPRKDNEEKIVDVRIRYCAIKPLVLFFNTIVNE